MYPATSSSSNRYSVRRRTEREPDLDDAALEARLWRRRVVEDRALPSWPEVHQELKKAGVTLTILWEEYRAGHPRGYSYSQFCERLFVNFSGKRPSLVEVATGEEIPVELFVVVLGAGGLIYAEATRSRDLASWVTGYVHMLEYFRAVRRSGCPTI